MQRRDFYFLLPTGITLIAAVTIELILGSHGPILPAPQPVFPGLADHLDELAWVRVSRGPAKVDFANVAGRWVIVEKDNYPADPARVRGLLGGLADLTLIEPDADRSVRMDPGASPAGEPARILLRARTGDTMAEAAVATTTGTAGPGNEHRVYVRKPGTERASLARGSLYLPDGLLGWLDRSVIDISQARVAAVKLAGADGATMAIRRDDPKAGFAVADLPAGTRLKTDAGVSELAGVLAGLVFDDVKPLALFELPEKGLARAEFVTFDGLEIDLRLFARDGADWVAIAASGTGSAEAESSAINDKLARWVYAIPPDRAKLLRTRLDDLIEPVKG